MSLFQKKSPLMLVALVIFSCITSLFSEPATTSEQTSIITISEYTDFLNSVAATDTYNLYNPKMGEEKSGEALIVRTGNPGSYSYSCNPKKSFLPITYVPWISAIRYCNWRAHHGATGGEDSSTTETGSYDLTSFHETGDTLSVILTPGASFFLPTNYLVSTSLNEESIQGETQPYLSSSHLGFCIGIWAPTPAPSNDATPIFQATEDTGINNRNLLLETNSAQQGTIVNGPAASNLKTSLVSSSNGSSSLEALTLKAVAPNSSYTNQVNISLVAVESPNNPPDKSKETNQVGYGAVLMPYQIGKYDVTAEEYCAFLNAVAKKSDPHQLYNTNMSVDPDVACITRSGDTNSGYTYTPISGREKYPITYVSWFSALRFCNWLENNQPTGEQTIATTESGSFHLPAATANPEAGWSLPTEDQWYKAAYYIPPTKKTSEKYALFGNTSESAPNNNLSNMGGANYALGGHFTMTQQPRLNAVGTFTKSLSPCGAYDMAGTVNQWLYAFDASGNSVISRGGSWNSQVSTDLQSTARFINSGLPNSTTGFRVVYNIPPAPKITFLDLIKDLVPVTKPNNASDISDIPGQTGFGSVSTSYQIGKYDVTAEQYCMFLNAVASHSDPHNLYNTNMTTDTNVACIIRYGNENRGYSYFPWPGREKFPITYVNFFSALRFCNWLENNQPIGDQSSETTESGSWSKDDQGHFKLSTNHPKWLLPTENQWYKAAYNSPDGFYYTFGTASFSPPSNKIDSNTNSANYCLQGNFTQQTAPRLTPVGIFTQSKSPWGAYDMAGNVGQWTLASLNSDPSKIVVRGGSWQSTDFQALRFSSPLFTNANEANSTTGFRVIYNVEPPPPTLSQVLATIIPNVTKTLYEDGQALINGKAATDPEISNRFFGYVTGPFIGGIYKWVISVGTLLSRNAFILIQKVLDSSLPRDFMTIFNSLYEPLFNFLFQSIGSSASVETANFATLGLLESIMTPAGEWAMLSANPPLAAAILLTGICTYAAWEGLQSSDPRGGIAFASFDAGYFLGIVATLAKFGL